MTMNREAFWALWGFFLIALVVGAFLVMIGVLEVSNGQWEDWRMYMIVLTIAAGFVLLVMLVGCAQRGPMFVISASDQERVAPVPTPVPIAAPVCECPSVVRGRLVR